MKEIFLTLEITF